MKKLSFHNFKTRSIFPGLMVFLITCMLQLSAYSQSEGSFWTDVSENAITAQGARYTIPQKYRVLSLNVNAMHQLLAHAPQEKNTDLRSSSVIITLPLPDGKLARFRFVESPIMEPELAAKFP